MDNQSNIVGGEEEIILEPEMFGGAPGTTDFNELENRPSYAGEVMTGETNIPAVPTAVSQLTNDSGYQTATDVADAVGIEATARQNADNGLQGQIDALAAASDVTDIVGTKAELNAYDTSKLKDNDIIKVLQDESQDDETTYYRWSTTTETFTLIGAEGPYYTKSATDQLLQAKQDKLTAGANITIDGNVISATDTTYSAFTGTDGVDAGTSGLVPAPATTDSGKFLNADGSWEEVQAGPTVVQTEGSSTTDVMSQAAVTAMKGKAKVLTSADYNWPTSNPDGVALWLLDSGLYQGPENSTVKVYYRNGGSSTIGQGNPELELVLKNVGVYQKGIVIQLKDYTSKMYYNVDNSGWSTANLFTVVTDNLTSTSTSNALSANQGKVLKDTIDGLITKNAGAPTTATVGTVGKLIEDTTNGKLYICTDTTGGSYTWVEVGAGGSGVTELTSADYNYDPGNTGTNTAIALWKLTPGLYSWSGGMDVRAQSNLSTNNAGVAQVWESNSGFMQIQTYSNNDFNYVTKVNATTGAAVSTAYPIALGGPTVVQSTGTSTTDVMSQNATTSMVFADPSTKQKVRIGGGNTDTISSTALAIGYDVVATSAGSVCIGSYIPSSAGAYSVRIGSYVGISALESVAMGNYATASAKGAIAIGSRSSATTQGQMDIGVHSQQNNYGYNSSDYRLLTGLYDPQSAHDAATKGYVDAAVTSAGAPVYTNSEFNNIWENA